MFKLWCMGVQACRGKWQKGQVLCGQALLWGQVLGMGVGSRGGSGWGTGGRGAWSRGQAT